MLVIPMRREGIEPSTYSPSTTPIGWILLHPPAFRCWMDRLYAPSQAQTPPETCKQDASGTCHVELPKEAV